MSDIEDAQRLVQDIHDAEASGEHERAASLKAELAEVNERLKRNGFLPVGY